MFLSLPPICFSGLSFIHSFKPACFATLLAIFLNFLKNNLFILRSTATYQRCVLVSREYTRQTKRNLFPPFPLTKWKKKIAFFYDVKCGDDGDDGSKEKWERERMEKKHIQLPTVGCAFVAFPDEKKGDEKKKGNDLYTTSAHRPHQTWTGCI